MTSALPWSSLFFFSVLSLFFLRSVGTVTTYRGCFYDFYPNTIRVLPLGMILTNDMTVGLCINHCLELDPPFIRYAGVEAGLQCWCGDENAQYGQLGQRNDGDCNTPCAGDMSQTCGADFHIQVYELSNQLTSPGTSLYTDGATLVMTRESANSPTTVSNWLTSPGTSLYTDGATLVMTTESANRPTTETLMTSGFKSGNGITHMPNTAVIIAGSAAGAGLLLIVLVIIVIIVCIRKRNELTKTGQNNQRGSRRENNNNDDQLGTSVTVGQNSDNPLAENMCDHTPTAQPNNFIPLYAVVNQTTPPPVVKTASKRPSVQAYAYTDCTINSPTMPNGRANNNNDDQLGTSVTVGQNSDNPLAENMYDHTPTAQPNNSIPLYAVVNQTTPPPVVKMASKRPTDQAYAYTECSINPPTMPNGDRQPIFADGNVTSGGRDSGWVDNNIYARTENNGGEEGLDNAAYATVNRNQKPHAAVSNEEKEGWAENSIYVTSN